MHQLGGLLVFLIFFKIILEKMGVKFAPLVVSWERRLQVGAAALYVFVGMLSEIVVFFLMIYLMKTPFNWLVVIYVFIVAKERNASTYGNSRSSWVRNWSWWHYLRDYFPMKLVKTADLSPDKNYLFCVFPHGVLSTGAFVNFATDASNFKELYPGLKSYMATLQGHFIMPVFRELIMRLGMIASSHDALDYILDKKKGTGKCAVLIVGGAAESLNCHKGLYKLILKNRKGFVKIAMRNGSSLVPVISFGETEIYEQFDNPEGSLYRKFQNWFQKATGVAPLLPLGRGFFQYSFGILPLRKTVTTVVGKPIEVKKNTDPSDEEISTVHNLFIEKLQELFDAEKSKYLSHFKDAELIIS